MTVHIVPVGLSIIDGITKGKGARCDGARQDAIGKLAVIGQQFSQQPPEPALAYLPDTGVPSQDFVDLAVLLRNWGPAISAEIASVAKRAFSPANDDGVLLLATDTDEGLQCAVLNAAKQGAPATRYVDSPAVLSSVMGAVTVVRIPDMDLRSAVGFGAAMRQLGLLARKLRDLPELSQASFEFHLAGGYKAAMPFLLSIAEGMRSLYNGQRVSAYCLHESSDDMIRIPLRYFPATQLSAMVSELEAVEAGCPPGSCGLEGYGYEYDAPAGGMRLTPFGEGLLAMFAGWNDPPTDVHAHDN